MLNEGSDLVTVLIGFGMSVAFIVFVCTRIICAWIQNGSQNRRIHHFESRVDLELPEYYVEEPEPEPQPALLEAIPTLKFNQEAFSSIGHTQCIICLTDYKERELLRLMPECGHTFHLSCIDIWLRKQATCPVCRISLKTSAETEHARHLTFSSNEYFDESDTSRGNEDLQIHVELQPTTSNSSQASSREPEARQ